MAKATTPTAAEKSAAQFEHFVRGLSPHAQATMRGLTHPALTVPPTPRPRQDEDDDTAAYEALPERLRRMLEKGSQAPEPEEPMAMAEEAARFFLVEMRNGEWDVVKAFPRPEALAARLGKLEGEDVVVRAFWGAMLPITAGPQRYLVLPDGRAMAVPLVAGGPTTLLSSEQISEFEIQEDGFLGPPALAEGRVVPRPDSTQEPAEVQSAADAADDEEDVN